MTSPPPFEEAVKHITDPNYRLGAWLVHLPSLWPGTETAKIHDLRYDYLLPGDDTTVIDLEARRGWQAEGCPEVQTASFFRIIRLWGKLFQEGEHICSLLDKHSFECCSYGQIGECYDMRCSVCGLHRDLKDFY
jgi:hypothetical protein